MFKGWVAGWILPACLVTVAVQAQVMEPALDHVPLSQQGETLQFRNSNSSGGGLETAASIGGGYYYDKPRYRAEYGYGSQRYESGDYYNTDYATQSCYGQTPGMFGNPSYDCKSFSVCQSDGRLDIMDCPAYTRFNNYLMVCDWPYKTDSYCNPIYKEEYYSSSYGRNYDKPAYYEKPIYEKSYYEKPAYSAAPAYPAYAGKNYGYYVNQYEYPTTQSYGYGYNKNPYAYLGSNYYSRKF